MRMGRAIIVIFLSVETREGVGNCIYLFLIGCNGSIVDRSVVVDCSRHSSISESARPRAGEDSIRRCRKTKLISVRLATARRQRSNRLEMSSGTS
jgi:hypothetical protein